MIRLGLCLGSMLVLVGCFAHQGQLQEMRGFSLYERDAALQKLERGYSQSPEDWEAYFLGELAADDRQYDDMNSWFERALGHSPRFDEQIEYRRAVEWSRHAAAGDSAFARRAYESARDLYRTALAIDGECEETARCLAETSLLIDGPNLATIELLQEHGSTGALYRWLDAEVARPSAEGEQVARRLAHELDRSAPNADAALLVAELARQRDDHPGMVRWYERAIADGHAQQQTMNLTRDRLATGYLAAAHEAYADGEFRVAIAMLDTTDILRPGQPESKATREALRSLTGNHSPAELDRLIASGEVDTEWLRIVLVDLYRQERWLDAEQVATRVLDDVATDEIALLASYRARLEVGARDSALVWLDALELAGHGDDDVAYNRGILSLETARPDDAGPAFAAALARGGDPKLCLTQLSILAFYEGNFRDMVGLGRRLVDHDPGDRDSWRLLSIAAQMNKDDDLAATCREKLEVLP